jgi:adenosylcobinamide-phosphate synthase
MTFISLLAALLLDLYVILPVRGQFDLLLHSYADFVRHQLDGGEHRLGLIAWLAVVLPVILGVWLIFLLLNYFSPVLSWLFNVSILFCLIHFKRNADRMTAMAINLRKDDLAEARAALADWRGMPGNTLDASAVARLSIEQAFIDVHRHWFGLVFWFVLLPGPTGPLLYWLASRLREFWAEGKRDTSQAFADFARKAFHWIDWIPQRLTAITFAIVGNFEDAAFCWRSQAHAWPDRDAGVLLSSGAGALGVRLGEPIVTNEKIEYRPELGSGEIAEPDHLHSAEGLIWRSMVVWIGLLLLLTVASWFGR